MTDTTTDVEKNVQKEPTTESTLYYFFSVGCGWCTRTSPLVDELNEEGYDILKLDTGEPVNKEIADELKAEYKIQCGTPFFIDADTGNHICGFREKDILIKWANGEKVPPPPRPKSPMPRAPFHGASKKEEEKWTKEYTQWVEENNQLPNLKTAEELLAMPRPKSQAPGPPPPNSSDEQLEEWGKEYSKWTEENTHLKNIMPAEQLIQQMKQRRRAQGQQQGGNANMETRVRVIENKIDKLMAHLGVK